MRACPPWSSRSYARSSIAGALALAFLIFLYLTQRNLIYFPSSERPEPALLPAGAETIDLQTDDGLRLPAWFLPPAVRRTGARRCGESSSSTGTRGSVPSPGPRPGTQRPRLCRAALRLPRLRRQPGEPQRGGVARRCAGGGRSARRPSGSTPAASRTSESRSAPPSPVDLPPSARQPRSSSAPRRPRWPKWRATTTRTCP